MDLLTNDLSAEFDPQVADVGDDFLLAVWTRVDGDVSQTGTPEDIAPHLEIVSTWHERVSGVIDVPMQLTTNNSVDRNPRPVKFGDEICVLWIRTKGKPWWAMQFRATA